MLSYRRNSFNNPRNLAIKWVENVPKHPRYKFYVGRAANADSQEDGVVMATQDAYRQAIRENYGIKVRVNVNSLETLKKTSYKKEIREASQEIALTGFKRKKIHVEKQGSTYHAWVLFQYSLKEIAKEKKRIKNKKPDYIRGMAAYWAGNNENAARLWGRSCADGVMKSCGEMGRLAEESGNETKAKLLYEKSCNGGYAMACVNVSRFEIKQGNIARAKKLLSNVCHSKNKVFGEIACIFLGHFELTRGGSTAKAIKAFSKICSKNKKNPEGCRGLGIIEENRGNIAKAEKLYIKSCNNNDYPPGCVSLGKIEKKRGNISRAEEIVEKACNNGRVGSAEGCSLLGIWIKDRNKAKATKFFQKACDNNDSTGCSQLGSMLMEEGNFLKAEKLYKKSCNHGSLASCGALGALEIDRGNLDKAKKLLKKGCEGGLAISCTFLGNIAKDSNKIEYANLLWRMACNMKEQPDMIGCIELGNSELSKGNTTKATKLFNKACKGNRATCAMLAAMERDKANIAKAIGLFGKSCRGGNMLGCSEQGNLLNKKEGNSEKAKELQKKSCHGGYLLGCGRWGLMEYEQGNVSKSVEIFRKACALGETHSCTMLKTKELRGIAQE